MRNKKKSERDGEEKGEKSHDRGKTISQRRENTGWQDPDTGKSKDSREISESDRERENMRNRGKARTNSKKSHGTRGAE